MDRKLLPLLYRIPKAWQPHRTEILHPPASLDSCRHQGCEDMGTSVVLSVLIAMHSALSLCSI